jgi:DNA-binding MarR family transcriptional regulator
MSVRLTPRAEKFLHALLPGHFKAIAALMSSLSEPERKTLVRLLNKIQQQAAELNVRREPAAAALG